MWPVSIVIMTKNEAKNIGRTLQSVAGRTDDIVIVDNGSTDATLEIARTHGCRIIETEWKGYGATKNIGIQAAKYDWVFSLDADECPDEKLLQEIGNIDFSDLSKVYAINRKAYFGDKLIRFGEWGGKDRHVRLASKEVRWSHDEVHEKLVVPAHLKIITLAGSVHHYTIDSEAALKEKIIRYAELSAHRYFGKKKVPAFKLWLAPAFGFIRNYIVQLGFLDGREGFIIAKLSAYYTWLKYYRLKQLYKQK